MRLTGLADRLGDPALHWLLVDAFGSDEAASKAIERYQSGEWSLFGYLDEGAVIGCIGLEPLSASVARIRGIAVARRRRGRGIGRSLITDAQRRADATLIAETDADAVDFYRGCGFDVESIGEQYAGVERFRCTLSREPERTIQGEL
jgi:N-acetylglutamate synthase-like GNAT family acetyltransferase